MWNITTFGLVALMSFLGQTLAYSESSSGVGGAVCGPRVCLAGRADCVRNKCKCKEPKYAYGKGYFNCYKRNEYRTEVTNDPHILTYNNNSIDLPFACRYMLTHAVSEYRDEDKNVLGSCELMIHSFQHKAQGKFYLAGFDAAFRIECNNGSRYEMTFRKYGTAQDGQYDFEIEGTNGAFVPDGPFNDDVIDFYDPKTGLTINCHINEANNLAEIHAKNCGQRIIFRPYDTILKVDQPLIPGMAASFNCAYRPVFESNDKVLALIPVNAHNGFDINSILLPGLGKRETMMHRAFMSGVVQNSPQSNPECARTKTALELCENHNQIAAAYTNCLWILTSPKFIKCFDRSVSGEPIQSLLNSCIGVYCGPNPNSCSTVTNRISVKCARQQDNYVEMFNFFSNCS